MNRMEPEIRPDDVARIRAKMEALVPDHEVRRSALELLAHVMENADDERSDGWELRERPRGLGVYSGRLVACRVGGARVDLGVLGTLEDETRAAIGAEAVEIDEFKKLPGGVLLTFPVEKASEALRLLKDAIDKFNDEAMGRIRTRISHERHVPAAVTYISSELGQELPQPSLADPDEDDDPLEPATREPITRGRAPIFETAGRSIDSLVEEIKGKTLALPDLQRPFVWKDSQVRDLLDSLFVGYPVGTLVLWHTSDAQDARAIGDAADALRANILVIDGQQRLTSLWAVFTGEEVIAEDGSKKRVTIAFRPRDGRFEVVDAAIRKDPEFLPDVSELWRGPRTKSQIRRDILLAVREKREADERYETAVDDNLDRAQAIRDYRFPVVEIRKTSASTETKEEDVADIFVRINNGGRKLGQADFVLTLLSVFHRDLRDRIEQRSAEISRESIAAVDAQQLLRAACAVGFGRARMGAVYKFLRGVDPVTGDTSIENRKERLGILDAAVRECIDSTTWRDYLLRVMHAGFVAPSLVAQDNAVVNGFAFYVLGRRRGVRPATLDELVSRWLFGTLLTARYSGSAETRIEQDLARVRDGEGPESFSRVLDTALGETLTGDYWTHTLPAALETQRGRAPAALAFRAAQVVLEGRALFSDQLLRNLLDPPGQGKRAAGELHHLFPQAWLGARGVRDRRRINQVANLATTGWRENNEIGARGPRDYVPRLRESLRWDDDRWGRACAEHALPPGWEAMDYETFLGERRQRMAEIIRVAYRKLGGEGDAPPVAPPWFLPGVEQVWRRIVEVERALRGLVRRVYATRFGDEAVRNMEAAVPPAARETLSRALRSRPAGADELSVVDYLYLGQLPALLFMGDVWQETRRHLGERPDTKQRLQTAVDHLVPVRNEIAHVREVSTERLQRAMVACNDVLEMIGDAPGR